MKWIKERLKEPSTWAAIAGGLMALGVAVDQATVGAIAGGVAAVIGIVFPEQSA
jgi:hypothetical protein